jgi:peroxiredoxin
MGSRAAGGAQVTWRQTLMGQSMPIEVGAEAPDFTLRDQNNEEVTLSSFRGHKGVLVIFYPLAFTGICTDELCAVRDDLTTFQSDSVQVLTVSVDSTYAQKIFSEREGYEFPLLSDFWPHGAVAKAYGVFNEVRGYANRGTFLIDTEGIVRFAEMNEPGQGRDAQDWREAIKALATS